MIFNKIERNSFARVFNLLSRIENEYIPPLTEQIQNMEVYIRKIVTYADTFIAIEGNYDVGILSIYCNDTLNKKAFITTIGIDSKYKRQGIAKQLLLMAIKYVKQNKFKAIELEVNKTNLIAIYFYKKNGFLINEESTNSYFMELKLP